MIRKKWNELNEKGAIEVLKECPELGDDIFSVCTLIEHDVQVYHMLDEEMKMNYEVALKAVRKGAKISELPAELLSNDDFFSYALENGEIFDEMDVGFFQRNVDVLIKAVRDDFVKPLFLKNEVRQIDLVAYEIIKKDKWYLLPSDYKIKDINVGLSLLNDDKDNQKYIDYSLFKNREFVQKALDNGIYISAFDENILKDRQLALQAVKNGASMYDLDEKFATDQKFIVESLSSDAYNYVYLNDNNPLKRDHNLILKALKRGVSLDRIPADLQKNEEYQNAAVIANIENLRSVHSDRLKDINFIKNTIEHHTSKKYSESFVQPFQRLSKMFLQKNLVSDMDKKVSQLEKELVIRTENLGDEKYRRHIESVRNEVSNLLRSYKEIILVSIFPDNIEEIYEKGLSNITVEQLEDMYSSTGNALFSSKAYAYLEFYSRLSSLYNNMVICIDRKQVNDQNIYRVKKLVEKFSSDSLKIRTVVDSPAKYMNSDRVNYVYTKKETQLLKGLDEYLVSKNQPSLAFKDFEEVTNVETLDSSWDFTSVAQANNVIDKYVKDIKDNDLTPFEAMLYIHDKATKFKYKSSDSDNIEEGRVLPSILNSDNIVCSGYSSFVKAIVDRLNMPELKCEFISCALVDETNKVEYHSHLLAKINDDKYNVNGYYIEDACWDSRSETSRVGKGYAHCLYPIEDLKHLRIGAVVPETTEIRYSPLKYLQQEYEERFPSLLRPEYNVNYIAQGKKNKNQKEKKILRQLGGLGNPDVIKKYSSKSTPIAVDVFKKGLEGMLTKIIKNPDKEGIEEFIEVVVQSTSYYASKGFSEEANSSFVNKNELNKTNIKR